jgi:hypothetical protein
MCGKANLEARYGLRCVLKVVFCGIVLELEGPAFARALPVQRQKNGYVGSISQASLKSALEPPLTKKRVLVKNFRLGDASKP